MRNESDRGALTLPWYEKEDFSGIQGPAETGSPVRYEDWRQQAERSLGNALATGRAVEIIRVKPDAYHTWLGKRPNTAWMRRRYAEQLAAGAVSAEKSGRDRS